MTREETLQTAEKMVCGHREQDYGTPEDSFTEIGKLWTAYKDIPFTPHDVAMMMSLLKIARIKKGSAVQDSYVDCAGYISCAAEIATREENDGPGMEKLGLGRFDDIHFSSAKELRTAIYHIKQKLFRNGKVSIRDICNIAFPETEIPKGAEKYGWMDGSIVIKTNTEPDAGIFILHMNDPVKFDEPDSAVVAKIVSGKRRYVRFSCADHDQLLNSYNAIRDIFEATHCITARDVFTLMGVSTLIGTDGMGWVSGIGDLVINETGNGIWSVDFPAPVTLDI